MTDIQTAPIASLLALSFIWATGCTSMHSLQTARTLPPGKVENSIELGTQLSPLRTTPLSGPSPTTPFPIADVAFRRGLGMHTDGWIRLGTSGLELGLKQELPSGPQRAFAWAVFASARGRYELGEKETWQFGEAMLGVPLQFDAHERVSLILTPRGSISLTLHGPTPVGNKAGFYARGGATAGAAIRIGDRFRVIPEIGWFPVPLLLAKEIDPDRPTLHVAAAVQWSSDSESYPVH